MKDGAPKRFGQWLAQWLAQQAIEKEDEDWNAYLTEEWESADGFISMVDTSLMPLGFEFGRFVDDARSALMTAHEANEPWLRYEAPPNWLELVNMHRAAAGRDPEHSIGTFWLKLKPRDTVLWLLSKPTYRHLVPAGLARAVLRDDNMQPDMAVTAAPTEEPKRLRGPKPNERNRVLLAMRSMPMNELRAMKEKEMEWRFGATRWICRKARNILEDESKLRLK